jgi:hypothetical protein
VVVARGDQLLALGGVHRLGGEHLVVEEGAQQAGQLGSPGARVQVHGLSVPGSRL